MTISKKNTILFLLFSFICLNISSATVLFSEDFEVSSGFLPDGWAQSPTVPFDDNGTPEDPSDDDFFKWVTMTGGYKGYPENAAGGNYNAQFNVETEDGYATKLISPSVNISAAQKVKLSFFCTLVDWSGRLDNFYILARRSPAEDWVEIKKYQDTILTWREEEVQIPDSLYSDQFQFAFDAHSYWGLGVNIDDVSLIETDVVSRFVDTVIVEQASTDFLSSGSANNPLLRLTFDVYGNNGDVFLQSLESVFNNDDNNDIKTSGIKLFYTTTTYFTSSEQIGNSVSVVNEKATFSGLNKSLPSGKSYIWVTADITENPTPDNKIDAYLQSSGIQTSTGSFPSVVTNPAGTRNIVQAVFIDDFESLTGWDIDGEFEIDEPQGLGGVSQGGGTVLPDPINAYSGSKVLGSDLTGIGALPGDIEADIPNSYPAYSAISPAIPCRYFKKTKLSFQWWYNMGSTDRGIIYISGDNGANWEYLFISNTLFQADKWTLFSKDISSYADRKDSIKLKFTVFRSESGKTKSGWNIDDFTISGDYIEKDAGVTGFITPHSGPAISVLQNIEIKIKNSGAKNITEDIPVYFEMHTDTGLVFESSDIITGGINSEETLNYIFTDKINLSEPGEYFIKAFTSLNDDEYSNNDTLTKKIYIIPTLNSPYITSFEEENNYWFPDFNDQTGSINTNSFWNRVIPTGTLLNTAYEGEYIWETEGSDTYPNDTSSLVSPYFDLSTTDAPIVEFAIWMETIASNDGMAFQYSVDTGQTWQNVEINTSYTYNWGWYNDTVSALGGNGWSGSSGGWTTVRQILPDEVKVEKVKFRFKFAAKANDFKEGIGIDYFKLIDRPADIGVSALAYPYDTCELSTNQRLTLTIENKGIFELKPGDKITVGARVDNQYPANDTFTLSQNVPVGETFNYQMKSGFDMYQTNNYNVVAYTEAPFDHNIFSNTPYNNDTLKTIVKTQKPYVELGPALYTTLPDTIVLDAFSNDTLDYLWQDGNTDSVYHVSNAGEYHVKVSNPACVAKDTINIYKLTADLSIDSIMSPFSDCFHDSSEVISFKVKNNGTDTITPGLTIDFSYKISGYQAVFQQYTFIDTLLPDSSILFSFDSTADLMETKDYFFDFDIHYSIDEVLSNNTISKKISTFGAPDYNLKPDSVKKAGWTYNIDAKMNLGYIQSYLWEDSSTTQEYTVNYPSDGFYSVTVTDTFGCTASDSLFVMLEIPDVKVAEFIYPDTMCGEKSKEQIVRLWLTNSGSYTFDTGTIIPFEYQIDTFGYKYDTFKIKEKPFKPEDTIKVEFNDTILLKGYEQIHNWYCIVNLPSDSLKDNDTIDHYFPIYNVKDVDFSHLFNVDLDTTQYLVNAGPGWESHLWKKGNDSLSIDRTLLLDIDNNVPSSWINIYLKDSNNCSRNKVIKVNFIYKDISIFNLIDDDTICGFQKGDTLRYKLQNTGNNYPIKQDELIYSSLIVNDSAWIKNQKVNLLSDITLGPSYQLFELPGAITDKGDYKIDLAVKMQGDIKEDNDTSAKTYYVKQTPLLDELEDTIPVDKYPYTVELNKSVLSNDWTLIWSTTDINTYWAEYDKTGVEWLQATSNESGCKVKEFFLITDKIGYQTIPESELKIDIFPLPASEEVYLRFIHDIADDYKLIIYDSKARVVKRMNLKGIPKETVEIDISRLSKGIYNLILINSENRIRNMRLIVE